MEFVDALGGLVRRRSEWTLDQKQPIGIVLSRTIEGGPGGIAWTPNPCSDALRLSLVVAGIKFTPGELNQRWTHPQPTYRPHQALPTPAAPPQKLPPETVIFIGTPELDHSSK